MISPSDISLFSHPPSNDSAGIEVWDQDEMKKAIEIKTEIQLGMYFA